MKKTGIALKYGYKAPLEDYYQFNCSRRNRVRISGCLFDYFLETTICIRTGSMIDLN